MPTGLQRNFDPTTGWNPTILQPDVQQTPVTTDFTVLFFGASLEMRTTEQYSYNAGSYSRNNGVASVTGLGSFFNTSLYPGQKIRNANLLTPTVEGDFIVLTNDGTTVTWTDKRPNVAAAASTDGLVHNLQAYSSAGSWATGLSIACEGKIRPLVVATGGANIVQDWGPARVQELVDQMISAGNQFGAVVLGSGLIGNALLAFNQSEAVILPYLLSLLDQIRGISRLVYIETPPGNRNVTISSQTFTAANRLYRKIFRDLIASRPWLRTMPFSELLTQQWGSVTNADIVGGWPESLVMQPDGTHTRFDGSMLHGRMYGTFLYNDLPWFTVDSGVYGNNRHANSNADQSGNFNNNGGPCWYGAFTKVTASAPATGTMPQNCSISVTNAAIGMSAVSSCPLDAEGGSDWVLTVTDASAGGIAGGSGIAMIVTGSPADATASFTRASAPTQLKDFLTAADVVGKQLDVYVPCSLRLDPMKEGSVQYVELKLLVTIGGVQYILCSAFSNGGVNKQDNTVGMSQGFSGICRFPRVTVPAGITAAEIDFVIKTQATTNTGTTVMSIGPGIVLDVIN